MLWNHKFEPSLGLINYIFKKNFLYTQRIDNLCKMLCIWITCVVANKWKILVSDARYFISENEKITVDKLILQFKALAVLPVKMSDLSIYICYCNINLTYFSVLSNFLLQQRFGLLIKYHRCYFFSKFAYRL